MHSLHRPTVVRTVALHEVNLGTWDTTDGSVPAILDASVNVAGVETLKADVKGDISLRQSEKHNRLSP